MARTASTRKNNKSEMSGNVSESKTAKPKTAKPKTAKPKTAKPKTTSSSNKKSKNKEEVVEEEVEVVAVDEETPLPVKGRRAPTKESVLVFVTGLIESVDKEIEQIRESQTKAKNIKFLRTHNKKLRVLRTHLVRILKQRQKSGRKVNVNSGLQKPVRVSKEMCKFAGWNEGELHSRVDVTRCLCTYIKDNNLQNPADRRQILADAKLSKILNYDSTKDLPLTYYRIQSHMKPHFLKENE